MIFISSCLKFIGVLFFTNGLINLYHLIGLLVRGEDYIFENDIYDLFDLMFGKKNNDDDDIWRNFSQEEDEDDE